MLPGLHTLDYQGDGFRACLVSPYGNDGQIVLSRDAERACLQAAGMERVFIPVSARNARGRIADPIFDRVMVPAFATIEEYPRPRSTSAEGTFLAPGQGFAMRAGGCMTIVARGGGHTLAVHCARYSLLSQTHIDALADGTPLNCLGKPPKSLPDAIANAFVYRGVRLSAVRIWGFWGLDPEIYTHDPNHPEYSERNKALIAYVNHWFPGCIVGKSGNLNMERLFFWCAERAGFTSMEYVGPLPLDGRFPSTRDPNPARQQHRYPVIVSVTE